MNKSQKAAVVEEIAQQLSGADAVFAVDYRGLSVSQAAELRARLDEAGAVFRVVKNSLTERAAEQAGSEQLKPMLEGPTALALVQGDAALAAKALNDTARSLRMLEFKGGILGGAALSAEDVRAIARLPTREILHGQLVGVVAAPLSGLARTLNALLAGIANQLQQIVEQRGGPEEAAAESGSQTDGAPGGEREDSTDEAPSGEADDAASGEADDASSGETPTDEAAEAKAESETDSPADDTEAGAKEEE